MKLPTTSDATVTPRFTRVIGHMVTCNEKSRYLSSTLKWLRLLTDGNLYVYDDCSRDGTYEHVRDAGVAVARRRRDVPSFEEDESQFRSAAWTMMEGYYLPTVSDWVLCIDADEFLLPVMGSITASRTTLLDVIERAQDLGAQAVTFKVAEAFGFDQDDRPLIRSDNLWGQISACRLVRWRPQGSFNQRKEGGGSIPTGWANRQTVSAAMQILHLGYARAADRQIKHARYASGVGHNPRHVASILDPPKVAPWTGPLPNLI